MAGVRVKKPSLHRFVAWVGAAVTVLSATASTGCGPGNVIAKNKTIADVDDQQATCKVAKDPLNPLIVEWPATSKVSLDSASKRGIVVVSYAGCTLKVLNECHAKGAYEYTGVTPARDKIDISSQDDLYARLPLGAVNLKGELDSGSSLKLDYIAVGQRVAGEAPTELEGDGCEGATHYVRTITLGAYSLDASAKAQAGASVDVGNSGGGIKRKEGDTRLRGSGDVEKCAGESPKTESAASDGGCGAPLQLDLAPLRQQGDNRVVASTFGEGLHTLNLAPTELSARETNVAGVASLRDIDPDYLKLFQDALHADRAENVRPQDKANAWAALASYPNKNPKKELAEKRQAQWQKTADDLDKLKTQYLTDKAKLDKLMALDDEVVPKKDKLAYQGEFKQVYEPHEQMLSVALGTNISTNGDETGSDTSGGNKTASSTSRAPKDLFRIDATGGYGLRTLSWTDPKAKAGTNTTTIQPAKAGMSGGYGQLVLTLPTIPVPGLGLSVLTRFDGAPGNLSSVLADGGIRIAAGNQASAFGLGLYVGYIRYFGSPAVTAGGIKGYNSSDVLAAALNASHGGADFRLTLDYEYYIGSVFSILLGGSVSGVEMPFNGNLPGIKVSDMGKEPSNPTAGSLTGVTLGLGGGFGLHFGSNK